MNPRNLAGMIVLNVALLVVLAVLCLTPQPAAAQLGAGRGDYIMIAGQVGGRTTGAVYIIDITSGRMLAVMYMDRQGLVTVARRDINEDVQGLRR
jgi:hypothetical protein